MACIKAPTGSTHLEKDEHVLLAGNPVQGMRERCLILDRDLREKFPAGSFIGPDRKNPLLQIVQFLWLPTRDKTAEPVFWARTMQNLEIGQDGQEYEVWQEGYSLARITLSQKGFCGERTDRSGPVISRLVNEYLPICWEQDYLLPDSVADLTGLLANLTLQQDFNLILTTGSTGITSRDIAPEAASRVIERRLPGFEQQMMQASLAETTRGIISRALAGTAGRTLLVNLPGSPAAVETNLAPLLPALKHTLDKLQDDPTECAN
ncbi:MAG: MogA/MoaB family molybdenum cofactor biosynthesis protein [Thermodesulfobacteriota bacterium]